MEICKRKKPGFDIIGKNNNLPYGYLKTDIEALNREFYMSSFCSVHWKHRSIRLQCIVTWHELVLPLWLWCVHVNQFCMPIYANMFIKIYFMLEIELNALLVESNIIIQRIYNFQYYSRIIIPILYILYFYFLSLIFLFYSWIFLICRQNSNIFNI